MYLANYEVVNKFIYNYALDISKERIEALVSDSDYLNKWLSIVTLANEKLKDGMIQDWQFKTIYIQKDLEKADSLLFSYGIINEIIAKYNLVISNEKIQELASDKKARIEWSIANKMIDDYFNDRLITKKQKDYLLQLKPNEVGLYFVVNDVKNENGLTNMTNETKSRNSELQNMASSDPEKFQYLLNNTDEIFADIENELKDWDKRLSYIEESFASKGISALLSNEEASIFIQSISLLKAELENPLMPIYILGRVANGNLIKNSYIKRLAAEILKERKGIK